MQKKEKKSCVLSNGQETWYVTVFVRFKEGERGFLIFDTHEEGVEVGRGISMAKGCLVDAAPDVFAWFKERGNQILSSSNQTKKSENRMRGTKESFAVAEWYLW